VVVVVVIVIVAAAAAAAAVAWLTTALSPACTDSYWFSTGLTGETVVVVVVVVAVVVAITVAVDYYYYYLQLLLLLQCMWRTQVRGTGDTGHKFDDDRECAGRSVRDPTMEC